MLGGDLILCRLSSLLTLSLVEANRNACWRGEGKGTCEGINDGKRSASGVEKPDKTPLVLIPADTAVILPAIIPHQRPSSRRGSNPLGSLLSTVNIEEVEALHPENGGPTSGQCQFACVASALSQSCGREFPLCEGYRPDLELRKLALHVISTNPELYSQFLVVAGGRTRSQNQEGGTSVDLAAYIRTMSSPSCDGDAVTLQALCDALKITVRVVKPIDADAYDGKRQTQRLLAALASAEHEDSSADDEENSGNEFNLMVDDVSSATSESCCSSCTVASATTALPTSTTYSNMPWPNNPYSAPARFHRTNDQTHPKRGQGKLKRLYVSQEIQPRPLNCVDSRICEVQRAVCGRLIWLSHVGEEAHYRFLRPMSSVSGNPTKCACSFGAINNEEAAVANRSRIERLRRLCCSYSQDKRNQSPTNSSASSLVGFPGIRDDCGVNNVEYGDSDHCVSGTETDTNREQAEGVATENEEKPMAPPPFTISCDVRVAPQTRSTSINNCLRSPKPEGLVVDMQKTMHMKSIAGICGHDAGAGRTTTKTSRSWRKKKKLNDGHGARV